MKLICKHTFKILFCFSLLSCSAKEPNEHLEQQSISNEHILKTAVISGAFMQKNNDEIKKEEDKKKKLKSEQQQESQGSSSGNEGQNAIAN